MGWVDTVLLVAFSVAYLSITLLLAQRRILWTDEIVTLEMARLPSTEALWDALSSGADTLPPLGHFLTRLSLQIVGSEHVGARLPAILGYWWMSLSIYFVVRRYTSPAHSAIALLLPTSTLAYSYAYEARPYGLVLGLGATTLLCWQHACEDRHRLVWITGLGASLAAAIGSHWYAVLLLVPLGLGELVRVHTRRSPDPALWGAVGLGCTVPLLAFYPMLKHAQTFRGAMASGSWFGAEAIGMAYLGLLANSSVVLLALLVAIAWFGWPQRKCAIEEDAPASGLDPEPPMVAAVVGLLLIPVCAAVMATVLTGVFGPRYLILTVIGFGIAIGLTTARLSRARPRRLDIALLTIASAAALFSFYDHKQKLSERSLISDRVGVFSLLRCSDRITQSNDPVVVPDVHSFYVLRHYSAPALASRLVYITDYNAVGAAMSNGMAAFSGWKAVDYRTFTAGTRQFWLYDSQVFSSQARSVLLARMVAEHASISDSGCLDTRDTYPRSGQLYRVRFPGATPSRP